MEPLITALIAGLVASLGANVELFRRMRNGAKGNPGTLTKMAKEVTDLHVWHDPDRRGSTFAIFEAMNTLLADVLKELRVTKDTRLEIAERITTLLDRLEVEK